MKKKTVSKIPETSQAKNSLYIDAVEIADNV